MKKLFLTLLFFAILAFVSAKFAAVGFIKDASLKPEDQPMYFKISPVFWLPAYLRFGPVISDFQIMQSLAFTLPYWLLVSYLFAVLCSLVIRPGRS